MFGQVERPIEYSIGVVLKRKSRTIFINRAASGV